MAARPKVPDRHLSSAEKALAEFFKVQGAVVVEHWPKEKTQRKALSDIFDPARWNRVLSAEIFRIALAVSAAAGRSILSGLGLNSDDYEADRTQSWLEEHASGVASGINGTTEQQLREALAAGLAAEKVGELFDIFGSARAPQIARTEVTAATGFGTREAAQQSGRDLTKTWLTGSNPRASHARVNGETVAMDELFSNGARWPGDSRLDDKDRSNCNCSMRVDTAKE